MSVPRDVADATLVEITLDGFAHGGAAVGRLPDGRACFVDYAIPGERVRARITDDRRRWARATAVEVLDASPDRVAPPCPLFGPGRCGGCTLQHIAPARQAELLSTVIADQVRRIGHLDVPGDGRVPMVTPHGADGLGYRNRARFAVDRSGHLAYRRARSHDLIPVDDCPLLEPAARSALHDIASGWRGTQEVGLQVGTDGRAALAVTAAGRRDPGIPSALPAVVRGSRRRDAARGNTAVAYDVAGRRFRAGATSFFQASVAAATVLVDLVRRSVGPRPGLHVVDCYAGVGLFAAALAADGVRVTAIEASAAACDDARANTAGMAVEVLRRDLGVPPRIPWPVDRVVLDPPRTGAGAAVMTWLAGLAPARVTYVSCDPATFARDARVLVDTGYALTAIVGVDQFTHTGHVELVATFDAVD